MKIYMKVGVYLILNKVNRKVYVGSTVNMGKRLSSHRVALRKNEHNNTDLQNDYNVYGEDSFTMDGLEYCLECDMEERETYWVHFYNALDSTCGYNKMEPDRSYITIPGTHSYKTPITVINIHTDNIKEYDSITECRRCLGYKEKMIRRVLKYWDKRISDDKKLGNENKLTVTKTYKGYIFIYSDQYDSKFNYVEFERKRRDRSDKGVYRVDEPKRQRIKPGIDWNNRSFGRKEIVAINVEYNNEITFNSLASMCRELDLKTNKVSEVLSGKRSSYKGYNFRYTGKTDKE